METPKFELPKLGETIRFYNSDGKVTMEASTGLSPQLQAVLEVDEITEEEIEAMHRPFLSQETASDSVNRDIGSDYPSSERK